MNHQQEQQSRKPGLVSSSSLFLLLRLLTRLVAADAAIAPLPTIAPPSIAYFSPSRDAKASSPFLPSRLEKLVDK